LVTDIVFVIFLHRIELMKVDDDRFRFFIVGTKAEKVVTVRFNVVHWPGILVGKYAAHVSRCLIAALRSSSTEGTSFPTRSRNGDRAEREP